MARIGRSEIDNARRPARLQPGPGRARGKEHNVEFTRQRALPVGVAQILDPCEDRESGGVEQNVDAAMFLSDPAEQRLRGRLVGEIASVVRPFAIDADDGRAFLPEDARAARADAVGRAGHDGDAAFKAITHEPPPAGPALHRCGAKRSRR
jgi:hypothetical protein